MYNLHMETNYIRNQCENFKRHLEEKQQELGRCILAQEELETQITHLKEAVVAISRLLGEEYDPEDAIGLTDAVRQTFKAGEQLTAKDVRTKLRAMGFDISKYGNVLNSIYTVLGRLASKTEIKEVGVRNDGQKAYTQNPAFKK
jgi:hypothetical protein